ncbi:hypothetical protein [Vibrio atypicus]|uniref:hypothetical protein n=1 Tax=Vibrio atypicus TaxID=558271 RepID=UPI00135750EA|nr:hypothetical protein [Vibrio atypicus]
MKKNLKLLIFRFQKILVLVMYYTFRFYRTEKKDGLVVGVETASILSNFSKVLHFESINLSPNRFYEFEYSYEPSKKNVLIGFFYRCYLLSCIVPKYRTITYVGSEGLVKYDDDGRAWEFEFIKSLGVNIVCLYTGTDIRSFRKMEEHPLLYNMDTIATYHPYIMNCRLDDREEHIKKICLASDRFADLIFNVSVDQVSYMKSDVEYLPYMISDNIFDLGGNNKWLNVNRLIVIHCPSSPIIKGSQVVRAAVKKLQTLGYDFEYVELIGVTHDKVLSELARAHIVLNEFYAFVPGVFGIEAMATNSVLLTSADKNIEPMLPEGANEAWVVTPYWEVFDNLKNALDSPVEQLQEQAERGYRWSKLHGSHSQAKRYLESKYEQI